MENKLWKRFGKEHGGSIDISSDTMDATIRRVCVCGAQLSTANHKMSENYYENELILPCCRAGIFRNGHKNIINHSCNAHRDTSQLKHIKQWCAHSKFSATLQWIRFDWTHPIHRPKSYMLITFDIDNPILWFILSPPTCFAVSLSLLSSNQLESNRMTFEPIY